ncbi:MAG: DUF4912 domain-containing protein [Firmicutes bacterium]|nr:DUF4912 domain-containing protein [Bacillota bacterium]
MDVNFKVFTFPERYNENCLVLLVRDPHCLFAYWELSGEQRDLVAKEVGCSWGAVLLVLRLYDVTGLNAGAGSAHSHTDISVHALADNFYMKDLAANKGYYVEMGVVMPDGRFVVILRSNTVTTPRDTLADGAVWETADLPDREVGKPVAEIETLSSADCKK